MRIRIHSYASANKEITKLKGGGGDEPRANSMPLLLSGQTSSIASMLRADDDLSTSPVVVSSLSYWMKGLRGIRGRSISLNSSASFSSSTGSEAKSGSPFLNL